MTGLSLLGYLWHNTAANACAGVACDVQAAPPQFRVGIKAISWFPQRFNFSYFSEKESIYASLSVLATVSESGVCIWGVNMYQCGASQYDSSTIDSCVTLLATRNFHADSTASNQEIEGTITAVSCIPNIRSQDSTVFGYVVIGTNVGKLYEVAITSASSPEPVTVSDISTKRVLSLVSIKHIATTYGDRPIDHMQCEEYSNTGITERIVVLASCVSQGILAAVYEEEGCVKCLNLSSVDEVSGMVLLPSGVVAYSTLSGGVYECSVSIDSYAHSNSAVTNINELIMDVGVTVVGLLTDPMGAVIATLEILDTTHPENNTVFGHINFNRKCNQQRLRWQLFRSEQRMSVDNLDLLEASIESVIARLLMKVDAGFQSHYGWLFLLMKLVQIKEELSKKEKKVNSKDLKIINDDEVCMLYTYSSYNLLIE